MIWKFCKQGILMMALGNCSFAMRGVDPAWDHKQSPECADSYAPIVVDGLTASFLASVTAELAQDSEIQVDPSILLGAAAISFIYTVSAGVGASTYNECRVARADWYTHEALEKSHAQAGVAPGTSAVPNAMDSPLASMTSAQQTTAAVPVGYFCTQSPSRPTLTICRHERAACEHARELLAVSDSQICAPRTSVWCFKMDGKPRCFATQQACETKMAASPTASGTCTERL